MLEIRLLGDFALLSDGRDAGALAPKEGSYFDCLFGAERKPRASPR